MLTTQNSADPPSTIEARWWAGAAARSIMLTVQSMTSAATMVTHAPLARPPGLARRADATKKAIARQSGTASFIQNIGSDIAAARSARGPRAASIAIVAITNPAAAAVQMRRVVVDGSTAVGPVANMEISASVFMGSASRAWRAA